MLIVQKKKKKSTFKKGTYVSAPSICSNDFQRSIPITMSPTVCTHLLTGVSDSCPGVKAASEDRVTTAALYLTRACTLPLIFLRTVPNPSHVGLGRRRRSSPLDQLHVRTRRDGSYLAFLLAAAGRRGFGCLVLVSFVLFAPTFVLNHVDRRYHPPFCWAV